MRGTVVDVPILVAPFELLLKAMGNGNCTTTPDVALTLGRCMFIAEANSSSNSSEPNNYLSVFKKMGSDSTRLDKLESESVTEEDSNSSPAAAGKSVTCSSLACRPEVEQIGSGISSVSSEKIHSFAPSAKGNQEKLWKKLPSSQYKGVVPQPNGRWGAQIYEKHQRLWLGTFNREEDAARAYDRAAVKFRGIDALTNFNLLETHRPESAFLRGHSMDENVGMLRKHAYDEEFQNNDTTCSSAAYSDIACSTPTEAREHLFDKAMTPSDVGKLNRLVIPKHYAEKYFPLDEASGGDKGKGFLLNFEDNNHKTWRFRYSYWNSSQSYVFTKGWSHYVKEKRLQAGDIVSFERGSRSHRLFITFRRRPFYLMSSAGPPPPPKHFPHFVNHFAVNGYPQLFYRWPPSGIDPIARYSIPSVARPNCLDFLSTLKSVSDDGKPSSLEITDIQRPSPSSNSTSYSSSVRLFGVNLQRTPLNLCAGIAVEEGIDQ